MDSTLAGGQTLSKTNLKFPGIIDGRRGKTRDLYTFERGKHEMLCMVASDRISAFDHLFDQPIPHKGQVLNQIAQHFLEETADIVPNWLVGSPDPRVLIGHNCKPIMVEMVVRGYLTGHAWREYKEGKREICGVSMPDGMKEHDPFPEPIITPTTKAEKDEDISRAEILSRDLVSEADYGLMEEYSLALFQRGTEMAAERGLILVDTKYEFGLLPKGVVCLIDEVHTPDSSRYFYVETYEDLQRKGEPQRQLSKEFLREWLKDECGFQGLLGQKPPVITPEMAQEVSDRYIELYEAIIGQKFVPEPTGDIHKRIEGNVLSYLLSL